MEQWNGSEYSCEALEDDLVESWEKCGRRDDLRLPKPNPYIPTVSKIGLRLSGSQLTSISATRPRQVRVHGVCMCVWVILFFLASTALASWPTGRSGSLRAIKTEPFLARTRSGVCEGNSPGVCVSAFVFKMHRPR